MPKIRRPRFGSLQFWPRKRAEKFIPSVNWAPVKGNGILGFIAYKAGMATALVKDTTDKSMTAGKKIYIPVTILEAPNMKVFSVRFYKNGKTAKDVIVSSDKELKRNVSLPQTPKNFDSEIPKEYDDIRIIVYSLPSQAGIKKTPDMAEIALGAKSLAEKLSLAKSLIGKEISIKDFASHPLVDVRGLTKGKGLVGPVKRFGIGLKSHKAEKGVRRPGTLGPWHPAHVSFRVAQAGQLGMFTRVHYNQKLISAGAIAEKNVNPKSGFKRYGLITTNFIILKGSVQGTPKRQVLLTPSFRQTKETAKKKYEFLEVSR